MNRKECIRLAFLIFVVLSLTGFVFAAAGNEKASDKEVLSAVEQRLLKKISVDFRETPIDDVIKTLAEQADIDVIKSPDVTGTVTAKLSNVPLREALDNILASMGYGYVLSENVIRIAKADQLALKEVKMVSKVYRITYADVKEVEAALRKFISDKAALSCNPGTSNIIVTDTEEKIKAMDTFIEEIDRVTPQILVEARIYDITSRDRLDLGIKWSAGRNTNFGAAGVTGVGSNTSGENDDPFLTGTFISTNEKSKNLTGALRFGFLNEAVDIDALLKAQAQKIDAKLLANPRILVLDNQTAEIKIVQQKPYQQLTQGGGTTIPFGTIDFKEIGITLNVVPHVTRDGVIRLMLKPSFSIQSDEVTIDIAGIGEGLSFPVPVIDKRDAITTLLVQDGTTVVLGGLRRKDVQKQLDKVPFLSDIPLIGELFKFKASEEILSEMVVFITPRIVETPVMSADESDKYNYTNFEGPNPDESIEVPKPK